MRRSAVAASILAAAALAPAAGSAPEMGFAFGRAGGAVRPFRVRIENAGAVRAHGIRVRKRKLEPVDIAKLDFMATKTRFTALPRAIRCRHTRRAVPTRFIRVGPYTVREHGTCSRRFGALWKALAAASLR